MEKTNDGGLASVSPPVPFEERTHNEALSLIVAADEVAREFDENNTPSLDHHLNETIELYDGRNYVMFIRKYSLIGGTRWSARVMGVVTNKIRLMVTRLDQKTQGRWAFNEILDTEMGRYGKQ